MRLGMILIIFSIAAIIYILPSVTAKFSGSHTVEFNESTRTAGLQCMKCHTYIFDELNATENSRNTLQKHMNAAGNTSYTSKWLTSNITNATTSGVCLLCHLVQVDLKGSHTKTIIRACTDLDCHGNNQSTNNTAYRAAGNVGPQLGAKNVHQTWFNSMSDSISNIQNETGKNYTKAYWTCLGCHTYVGVNINVIETPYNHSNASAPQRRYL